MLKTTPSISSTFSALFLFLSLVWGQSLASAAPGDQNIVGWGYNEYGQLGTGNNLDKSLPFNVTGSGVLAGKTVTQLTAGALSSFAVCSDGTIAAWGANNYGQLGNGNTTTQYLPIPITGSGVLVGKTIKQLAAGYFHTVALCTDGTLATWGNGASGQLGDGTFSNKPIPSPITGMGALSGKTVVQISAGAYHTLALCSDGTLVAWGQNFYGAIGDGTTADRGLPTNITNSGVLLGRTVTKIIACYSHNLVLCSDNSLVTWGRNDTGQLGDGTNVNRLLPTPINGMGALGGKTVVQMAGGVLHSYALCNDGTLAAWGDNEHGQLGNGSSIDQPVPIPITGNGALGGKTIQQITSGQFRGMALCTDGSLVVWGLNQAGQLGDGSDTNKPTPIDITRNGALNGTLLTQLVPGGNHTLVLANTTSDSIRPTPTITTPFPNQKLLISGFNSNSMSGSATDNIGVTSVETKITRLRNGAVQIWNGTAWGTANVKLPATITGSGTSVSWKFNTQFPPANQLDTGEYIILVYASDAQGNVGSASTRVTLYASDTEKPVAFITTPTLNQKILLSNFIPGALSGTANDNIGVNGVKLKLSRKRDGENQYWNGTTFTPSAFLLNATVTPVGGTSVKWNLDSQMPPAAQLDSGLYQLEAYAIDVANNKSVIVVRPFTLGTDFTAPSVAITTPTQGQKIALNNFVAGTVNGTAADNIGVTSVKVKLQRKRGTTTTYWNGSAFATTVATVDAVVTTVGGTSVTWKLDQVPTPASGLDAGAYTLYASSFDAVGNAKSSASRSFTLSAPVAGDSHSTTPLSKSGGES